MALTILERPIGVVLGTCVDANINQDYNGFATVNKTTHNLSDNDWVYIQSDVQNYNGFWQIDVINANEFALRNSDGTYVSYVVDADITYCPEQLTHGWSCVHLPITYKILNNKYPVNSVDTVRTITGLSNNSNFAHLTLSGSLGTFEDLQFIKISNAPDSNLDGVYQIIDKISNSSVILNVAYTTFTNATILGASIQLYYGNYNVVVRVYAGINSSHEWASEKPYELAATLELIPDENNEVFFSINDILKPYVKTENNLLLPSLPNNVDGWTNFYVSTAEQYDSSNGYTIATTETGFTSDQDTFEGTAVNAMLQFKNIHSGYLSDYLMTNNAAKFLTLFTIPVIFSCGEDTPDCYQDISFLNPTEAPLQLRKEFYSEDSLATTVIDDLGVVSTGLVRVGLDSDCSYDRVDLTLISGDIDISNLFADGFIETSGSTNWSAQAITGLAQVALSGGDVSHKIGFQFSFLGGYEYDLTQLISGSGHPLDQITITLYESYGGGVFSNSKGSNTYNFATSENFNITPSGDANYIVIEITKVHPSSVTFVLGGTTWNEDILSETKTFDIDCGCADQEIRLSWINNLGGFDYWTFTSQTGHSIDITQATETKKNIFPNWGKSWGVNADTIRRQTSRTSMVKKFITSQFLGADAADTIDKADALAYIKSSPLVQIINSRQDRRTVIVDTDSFVKYTDGDKLVSISFNITYTDDIPSQRV